MVPTMRRQRSKFLEAIVVIICGTGIGSSRWHRGKGKEISHEFSQPPSGYQSGPVLKEATQSWETTYQKTGGWTFSKVHTWRGILHITTRQNGKCQ